MLRTLFVLLLVTIGVYYSLQGPFYALLFYIWNAYFRPEEWVWTDHIRSLKLSFFIGIYVVLTSLFSGQRFVLNVRVILILLFLLHTFLSTLFSEHFDYSWFYWKDFLKSTIITYLVIVLVNDFSKFRLVLFVMVLSLGFEGAKQGWFYLLTSPGWANPNHIAFLGDNNGIAVGMLMLIPPCVLLAQTAQWKWERLFYWFMLMGVLYRALSTYSRGGFLCCLALAGAYWFHSRQKLRVLFSMVVVIAIVFPTLPDTFWDRMQTIQTYEEVEDASALGRLHFWSVALTMANAKPFLGIGYQGYNLSYNDYDFSQGEYGRDRSVHSSFLATIAELGYLGATLFGLILFCALRSCRRIRRLAKDRSALWELGQSARALEASLIVFLVGGSFVIFQYNEMLWHYIGLTIALAELATQLVSEASPSVPPQAIGGAIRMPSEMAKAGPST
jgi:probable O-glycosylation ligase (exosortase A-associated)